MRAAKTAGDTPDAAEIADRLGLSVTQVRELITARELAGPRYLSVSQVARRLGVSARHVYDLIAARELPASQLGNGRKALRVKVADLETFERSRELA